MSYSSSHEISSKTLPLGLHVCKTNALDYQSHWKTSKSQTPTWSLSETRFPPQHEHPDSGQCVTTSGISTRLLHSGSPTPPAPTGVGLGVAPPTSSPSSQHLYNWFLKTLQWAQKPLACSWGPRTCREDPPRADFLTLPVGQSLPGPMSARH